ncbi:hypothetical protein M0R45_009083 [Rubus argutus]|uniref:Uncharacterized protein n=1 Tax=Rubus argutus TaxID=59490 RepID=A0AAW1Y3X8_RUBAR
MAAPLSHLQRALPPITPYPQPNSQNPSPLHLHFTAKPPCHYHLSPSQPATFLPLSPPHGTITISNSQHPVPIHFQNQPLQNLQTPKSSLQSPHSPHHHHSHSTAHISTSIIFSSPKFTTAPPSISNPKLAAAPASKKQKRRRPDHNHQIIIITSPKSAITINNSQLSPLPAPSILAGHFSLLCQLPIRPTPPPSSNSDRVAVQSASSQPELPHPCASITANAATARSAPARSHQARAIKWCRISCRHRAPRPLNPPFPLQSLDGAHSSQPPSREPSCSLSLSVFWKGEIVSEDAEERMNQ